jgi:transcription antitermination protein NusB
MGLRRRARETTLQILYSLDIKKLFGLSESERNERIEEYLLALNPRESSRDLAGLLVRGVCANLKALDDIIENCAENWAVDRLSSIDRNILRLAVYELAFLPNTPFKVAINEAVEIAKDFGADDSARFVNGVLDKVRKTLKIDQNSEVSRGKDGIPA